MPPPPDPPGYTRPVPLAAIPDPPGYAPAPPPVGFQGYGGPDPSVSGGLPPESSPEKGWLDVGKGAVLNAPRSTLNAVTGIAEAIADPVTTGKVIGSALEGGLSKLGELSPERVEKSKQQLEYLKTLDPDKPVMVPGIGMIVPKNVLPRLEHEANFYSTERVAARKEIEKTFDTMKDFYVERYGSMEGFKKAVEQDPMGVLLDASTLFTGAGGVLRGSGALVSKVGATGAGKLATTAGTKLTGAGQFIDPINQSLNIGKWVGGKFVPTATAEVIGGTTGAGAEALSEAFQVAKARAADPSSVPAAEAYKRLSDAMAGSRTPEQTVALANQGIQTMKADASRAYTYARENPTNGWYHDATVLSTQPVRDAWNKLYASLHGKNGEPIIKGTQWTKIQEIGDEIAKWEMGNPAGHTLGGFDDLKKTIEAMRGGIDDTQLNRVVTALTNEAKGIAGKQSDVIYAGQPNNLYRESLKGYEKTMGELEEIESSLGVGRKQSSIDSAARKLTSVMRNNVNTNFGQRVKNVEKLEQHGSIDIMPEIAGHALNTWSPRGIMRALMSYSLATAPAALGLPFISPKLMGHAARQLGTMAGVLEAPAQDVGAVIKAGQKAGAPVAGQLSHIGQGEYDYGTPPLARGGTLRRLER